MARSKRFVWMLGVATVSLLTAVAVYSFVRIHPPDILAPFQTLNANLASHTDIFGSAPSFFYTLALGLIIGLCASNRSSAKLHCYMWIGLSLLLEISQCAVLSAWITTWFAEAISESGWNLIGPYWMRGVFDPIDLLATLVGGLIAMVLIAHIPMADNNASA